MILVADGGSTSCDWIGLNSETYEFILKIKTKGLNPAYSSIVELEKTIKESSEILEIRNKISAIYFFGAGCNSPLFSDKLKSVFDSYFPRLSKVRIKGDIHGAVFASTDKPSVVGILGTGSNVCYFDGKTIHTKIESLGYSVMDDGAGSTLGRLLLRAYFYKQLPTGLSETFEKKYNLNPDFVKENIYHKPFPGRFMASYAKFIFDHIEEPFFKKLLIHNLNNYFETHVIQFRDELKGNPIYFVGSIAYLSRNEIKDLCESYGFELGNIIQSPIDNLAKNIDNYI